MTRVLLLLALVLSGCTSFELTRVRNSVDRTPGVEIGEGYALSFGRLSVGTVRQGLRMSDDDDGQSKALRDALGHVRKAQFARYRVESAPPLDEVETPPVVRRYVRKGWMPAVVARDGDAAVWILAKDRGDELRDLLLVTLLPDELIIGKLSGDLTDAAGALFQSVDVAGLDDLFGTDALADSTATEPQ